VARRYWKTMREQGSRHAGDPVRPHDNPWLEQAVPELSTLDGGYGVRDEDRAARYADWAARLRAKGAAGPKKDGTGAGLGYWSAEALFEDSRRLAHEEAVARGDLATVRELLALFDLREDASRADLGTAYRRLAKAHHPDRFMMADPETQAFHEAEMRRVIDAYEALCRVVA
jgi:hypothetical protein